MSDTLALIHKEWEGKGGVPTMIAVPPTDSQPQSNAESVSSRIYATREERATHLSV